MRGHVLGSYQGQAPLFVLTLAAFRLSLKRAWTKRNPSPPLFFFLPPFVTPVFQVCRPSRQRASQLARTLSTGPPPSRIPAFSVLSSCSLTFACVESLLSDSSNERGSPHEDVREVSDVKSPLPNEDHKHKRCASLPTTSKALVPTSFCNVHYIFRPKVSPFKNEVGKAVSQLIFGEGSQVYL